MYMIYPTIISYIPIIFPFLFFLNSKKNLKKNHLQGVPPSRPSVPSPADADRWVPSAAQCPSSRGRRSHPSRAAMATGRLPR